MRTVCPSRPTRRPKRSRLAAAGPRRLRGGQGGAGAEILSPGVAPCSLRAHTLSASQPCRPGAALPRAPRWAAHSGPPHLHPPGPAHHIAPAPALGRTQRLRRGAVGPAQRSCWQRCVACANGSPVCMHRCRTSRGDQRDEQHQEWRMRRSWPPPPPPKKFLPAAPTACRAGARRAARTRQSRRWAAGSAAPSPQSRRRPARPPGPAGAALSAPSTRLTGGSARWQSTRSCPCSVAGVAEQWRVTAAAA